MTARARVQIHLNLRRRRTYRLSRGNVAHDLELRVIVRELIDFFSEAGVFVVQVRCHGRFLLRGLASRSRRGLRNPSEPVPPASAGLSPLAANNGAWPRRFRRRDYRRQGGQGSEAAGGGFPICLAEIEKICYKIPMDRIQIAVDGGGARERVGAGSNATRSASWAPGQFFLLESAVTH